MISTQQNSDFKNVFSRLLATPSHQPSSTFLKAAWLDTPLGPMLAIADETTLILLEFIERKGLENEVIRLQKSLKATIQMGSTSPIVSIERELQHYFAGQLMEFKTPLQIIGSPFQQHVWQALRKIPYGKTQSYLDLAKSIDKPTAFRAVAQANSTNQLAIIIPCHRVINANGNLGGYAGGLSRKQWLLAHEKQFNKTA